MATRGRQADTGALTEPQFERFQRAIAKERLPMKDAVREAVVRWSVQFLGEDPWKALIGSIEGGPVDASSNIDDIYLEE